jgi:ribose transport system substrate-binding protein
MNVLRAGKSRRSVVIVATLVAALVAALAASTASGTRTKRTATAANGVAQAKAIVSQASKRPTSIGITKPIGKKVPGGKKITYVSCAAITACTIQGTIVAGAAKLLGWSSSTVTTDGSPQQLQNAFDSAIRTGSNGIINTAITRANLETQIQSAKSKGIPVSTCCSTSPPGNGVIYNTSTITQNGKIGKYLAAKVVADTNGKGSALYVNISAFAILGKVGTSFQEWYKKLCPSCKFESTDIPLSGLGKAVPDKIVSFLRSHTKVDHVVMSDLSSLAPGVSAALRAAGLSKVKILGQGGSPSEYQEIRSGTIEAAVPFDFVGVDYQMVDAIARYYAKVPIQLTAPPLWLVTKQNVPKGSGVFPLVANYKAQWLKLWGKK